MIVSHSSNHVKVKVSVQQLNRPPSEQHCAINDPSSSQKLPPSVLTPVSVASLHYYHNFPAIANIMGRLVERIGEFLWASFILCLEDELQSA